MIYKSIDIKFCVARNTGERVCYTSRTLLSGIIICRERLVEKKKKKNANCKYKTKIRVIATIRNFVSILLAKNLVDSL